MITTIRKPATKIRYRHECECGAILEFDKEDIVESNNSLGDKLFYFECPYCKERVVEVFNINLLLRKFETVKVYEKPEEKVNAETILEFIKRNQESYASYTDVSIELQNIINWIERQLNKEKK